MTELGEFGAARGNFEQDAARECLGASQAFYEHPWGAKSHTLAKLFLPGLVREFFGDDGRADRHDLVNETPMQALAMGRQLPLAGRFAPAGRQIPRAVVPRQATLPMLLDPP
jgi:hypothetical protein